ncbi:hypothetical protein [Streptomyces humi]|uniref:hypothetical protein n=1 Tax=Streptomyces humi TaxID=1428620 RepID=UPI000628733D|nr:hypothetical protein [Streptomyces humi]
MNVRIATVSAVSAVLLATGATAAVAAPAPALTVKASAAHVRLGDVVTFTGRATGIKDGSKVTLQVKDGRKWLALPGTAKVKKGAYKLGEKFDDKGAQVVRAKDGRSVSEPVSVEVR